MNWCIDLGRVWFDFWLQTLVSWQIWVQFETLLRSFLKNISTPSQCTLRETTEFLKWSLFWFLLLSVCSDGSAVVAGAAGSPLQVECSDVNRDYVFLSWMPPSADGAAAVQGYFIERWNMIHDVRLLILREIGAVSSCFFRNTFRDTRHHHGERVQVHIFPVS